MSSQNSSLNQIIPPEISHDVFYKYIVKICSDPSINTVLEIGSSAGQGSTLAFVSGLTNREGGKRLFCLEVSKVRFDALRDFYKNQDFVRCYNCSSVPLDAFPTLEEVVDFYFSKSTGLRKFDLKEVLKWLQQDIDYIATQNVLGNGIEHIKAENDIDFFDVVLIDGSEFTGKPELDEVYGAKYILLDDINTFKNYDSHFFLVSDPHYQLIAEERKIRNGFSIFKRIGEKPKQDVNIPVSFLTIVLNGKPFIEYHLNIFKQLPFNWHWHIVEGVAELKHDTAWSLAQGGRVDESLHRAGLSLDGTTELLDDLSSEFSDKITLYRKPNGEFWNGKCEMVNAPLKNINEECVLWQVDVDEFWTVEQFIKGRELFIRYPHKTAAYYWCHYFVGPNLVVNSRNCYSQDPNQDWLRTWRFKPGMFWAAHEPPTLCQVSKDNEKQNIARINPFSHSRTEREGLVFQHFAYFIRDQLLFKEKYYGYENALQNWLDLNGKTKFPVFLRDYFEWVTDDTTVDIADGYGLIPLIRTDGEDNFSFLLRTHDHAGNDKSKIATPKILIDGVFFQLLNSGIGRVWKSLLEEWSGTEFADSLVVLDRDGTAPKVEGIRYRKIPAYLQEFPSIDSFLLQKICDEEGADLFLSTYYTTPIGTPSILLVYDMIPEIMENDLSGWSEKIYSIHHASGHVAISQNTAKDLEFFYPQLIESSRTEIAYCGVSPCFQPKSNEEIQNFCSKYRIKKPFFCTVGERSGFNGYKNAELFFKAVSKLENKSDFSIVCLGGSDSLEQEFCRLTKGIDIFLLRITDEELAVAYSGAMALVYSSKYEGFGMPIAEAMACGCPVITCRNSSIPEVAGEAALYVGENSVDEMLEALQGVQNPEVRQSMVKMGLLQAQNFSWAEMASKISKFLLDIIVNSKAFSSRSAWLWKELRTCQSREQEVASGSDAEIFMLLRNLDSSDISLLYKCLEDIKAIENSKLWKIRNFAFRFKRMFGENIQMEPCIDHNSPFPVQLVQAKSRLEWMKNSNVFKLKKSLSIRKISGL